MALVLVLLEVGVAAIAVGCAFLLGASWQANRPRVPTDVRSSRSRSRGDRW